MLIHKKYDNIRNKYNIRLEYHHQYGTFNTKYDYPSKGHLIPFLPLFDGFANNSGVGMHIELIRDDAVDKLSSLGHGSMVNALYNSHSYDINLNGMLEEKKDITKVINNWMNNKNINN